jgi:tetratricopeptide (TPR) repeat protein
LSRKAALLGAALMLTACAAALPAPYRRARAAAERSYAHGRYDEAARHWLEAAKAAERRYDRDEAHYRAAASFRRARRYDQAQALYAKLLQQPAGARAARIEFDLATLVIERGEPERGHALLERAIRRHPASGLSRAALSRYLDWLRDHRGAQATLAWLDSTRRAPALSALAESLEYARARELERGGQLEPARDAYLDTARRFPYPRGAYWDDCLYRASLIDEQLGRYQTATAHLRRMLAEREPSHLQGSYQRPRFAPAQYRIAELYRDRLGDPLTARREFRRVFSEHDTSPLRDDALWNEALLAARAGDRTATCQALGLLLGELSESRYAACAPALCPTLAAPKGARCRAYIQRQLDELPAGRR